MKSPDDPADRAEAARLRVGASRKGDRNVPALGLIGVGLLIFIGCLVAFATGHPDVGVTLATLAGAGLIAGGLWLMIVHRRLSHIVERWYAEHPDVMRQSPSG